MRGESAVGQTPAMASCASAKPPDSTLLYVAWNRGSCMLVWNLCGYGLIPAAFFLSTHARRLSKYFSGGMSSSNSSRAGAASIFGFSVAFAAASFFAAAFSAARRSFSACFCRRFNSFLLTLSSPPSTGATSCVPVLMARPGARNVSLLLRAGDGAIGGAAGRRTLWKSHVPRHTSAAGRDALFPAFTGVYSQPLFGGRD